MRNPDESPGCKGERNFVHRVAFLLACGFARSRAMNEHADSGTAEPLHPDRDPSHLELSNTADLHPALAVDASQKREVR